MRILAILFIGGMMLFAGAYLKYHPGFLSRPQVGDPIAELEMWFESYGYQRMEGRSAGPGLYEWSPEVTRNEQNREIWNEREENGRLLNVHRYHRSQRLCGMGVYLVLWREDAFNSSIAEIFYEDNFCHI